MSTKVKLEIPSELYSDLKKLGDTVAKNIAISIREQMVSETKYAISMFYNSYNPLVYQRTYNLEKGYRPYYSNSHKTRYYGGVEFTTDKMKDVYNESKEHVLNLALSGVHGKPSIAVTSPWIYEHVYNYRNVLYGFINIIGDNAVKQAKNEKYSILKYK